MNEVIKHFSDKRFTFDEKTHTYKLGDKELMSVTEFKKHLVPKFHRDYWAVRKAKQKTKETGKYCSKQDILDEWQYAADMGTGVHEWIENFYNGARGVIPEDEIVYSRVKKWKLLYEQKLKNLDFVASELRVFDEEWGLAGTIDVLYKHKGFYMVGDWKTNKKMTTDDDYSGAFMEYPFHDEKHNKVNEYSLQLCIYSLILERAGFDTNWPFLGYIGPDYPAKVYMCKDYRVRLNNYINNEYLEDKAKREAFLKKEEETSDV